MSIKKIKVPELGGCGFVSVYYDNDLYEYQVRISGKPNATYFTDDKKDAIQTAQKMRNDVNAFIK